MAHPKAPASVEEWKAYLARVEKLPQDEDMQGRIRFARAVIEILDQKRT